MGDRERQGILPTEAAHALVTQDGLADPYPLYARLRDEAPVYLNKTLGMYLLTRYRDCAALLTNPSVRVPDHAWHDRVLPGWREHPAAEWCFTSLPFQERVEHARIRTLVNRSFTRRRVATLVPSIKGLVDRLLDALGEHGADGRVVDLQEAVGFRLPVAVIAALVGVPEEDLPRFRWLFGDILQIMDLQVDEMTLARADEAMLQVREYFTHLLQKRRTDPGDDLASALITARADDASRLSEEELLSLIILLFTGGFETTTLTIGTGTHALLSHPEQRDLLRADPTLAGSAADEVLRWDCVVQRVVRVTEQDLELGEDLIPAGSAVAALLGAANRDPRVFDSPDQFDILRRGERALSFGGGPYSCLGYALAKTELETFFAELNRRFPDIELAGEPVRRRGSFLRGIDSLPISLGAPVHA